VLLMAVIPTLLFYFALFLMVEIDAASTACASRVREVESVWPDKRYWFHFLSLVSIVAFMLWGFSPVLVGVLGPVVALATSILRRDRADPMGPVPRPRLGEGARAAVRLRQGDGRRALGMLNVGATCAGAGIIVGVVTLTGWSEVQSIVIDYAQGSLLLTAIFTSLVVWIVGLAVPVTASYIICA
jgi:TRAP-type uncharacterized transport system fused permease subunit